MGAHPDLVLEPTGPATPGTPRCSPTAASSPPTRVELEELLDLLGVGDPREVVRDTEHLYRELDLADADRDELLDAIATHPILLQRPLVVRGERAVIGRPPERVAELLDG